MANNFLRQLERRRQQHLVAASSHVDKPFADMSDEERQNELQRLEWEKTKAEIQYGEELRQATASANAGDVQFGLASNNAPRSFFSFVKVKRRPYWR